MGSRTSPVYLPWDAHDQASLLMGIPCQLQEDQALRAALGIPWLEEGGPGQGFRKALGSRTGKQLARGGQCSPAVGPAGMPSPCCAYQLIWETGVWLTTPSVGCQCKAHPGGFRL